MPPRRTAAVAAAMALVVGIAVGMAPAAGARTAARSDGSTIWLVPSDGIFPITGHGYGHGHGMAQWGAQGAAEQGVSATAILDAYYPGTQTAAPGARPIRVQLSGAGTSALTVWPASGLSVTDLAGGRADTGTGTAVVLPTGPDRQRWRVVRTGSGFDAQSFDGTTWTDYAGAQAMAGPVRFADAAGIVRVLDTDTSSRDYRGTVTAVAGSGTALRVVNALELDDYVRGVVPRESPSSWLPAALQAQAIAARSYAAYAIAHPASAAYDICDSSACQVYGGKHLYQPDGDDYELETPNTDAAVAATAHQVRTYGGAAIFAQFSASDGGWTVAGSQPYLTAHPDPWDGVDPANTGHTWSASLPAAALQKAFPSVGTLTSVEVAARDGNGDWGGRVTTVVLHGTDADGNPTSVSTTGSGVMNAYGWPAHSDGLRSSWWTVGTDATIVAPPTAPGVVPLTPRLVLATSGRGIVAGAPRSLALGRLLPAGTTAVVLAVDARGRGAGVLTGEPQGRPALRVPLAPLLDGKASSGFDIVRVAAKGGVTLRVSAGAAAVRVRLIAAIAPGGVVPVGARPVGALRFHATAPPMSFTIAGSARLAAAGTGPGLSMALPLTGSVTATGRPVTLRLRGFALPPGRHGVLLAVTTSAATRLAPTGSPSARVVLAAPALPSTTALVVLPQRDGRISVVARRGTVIAVTAVAWV